MEVPLAIYREVKILINQRSIVMTNPSADGLNMLKRWVRIQDGTKVRFGKDGSEGIIDGLTESVVGPRCSPAIRIVVSDQCWRS